MITSIEITNWKTHKSTRMEFQKGVNVLIGLMGAGKSSVMDAISFALFGTFPALNSKRVSLSNLITNRPSQESSAQIKLNFRLGDEDYVVTRKFGDGGSASTLEKNGQYLQSQPSKVTEEIAELLKLDYDTFSRAIYAEQNRLDYFLELPKGQRKDEIDRMLGLDQFAQAEDNATSVINNMKSMIESELEALSKFDSDVLTGQLKALSEEKRKFSDEKSELKEKAKELLDRLDKDGTQLKELKEQHSRKISLQVELEKVNSRISTIKGEAEKLREITESESALSSLVEKAKGGLDKMYSEVKQLQLIQSKLTRSLATADAEKKQAERKKSEKERLMKELGKEKLESITKSHDDESRLLNDLVKKHAELKARHTDVQESLKELKKHVSKCPVCEREMDEPMRLNLINAKEHTVDQLNKEFAATTNAMGDKNSRIKELEILKEKVAIVTSKLSDYKNVDEEEKKAQQESDRFAKELKETDAKLSAKEKEHEKAKAELDKLKERFDKAKRKALYEKEVLALQQLSEKTKKSMDSIHVDDKVLDSLQGEFTKQSAALSDVNAKLSSNEKFAASLEQQITEKAQQITSIEKIKERVEKRRGAVLNMNKFKGALIDTEASLRNRLVGSVNSLLGGLWPELYPYGDYHGLRMTAKKDDYLLEANLGSEWVAIDSVASGGERSVACLAMRIALAMVIVPNLKWLILDEPTHNLDATSIYKLIDVLGNSLPNVVEQIFIITHDEELKQINQAKIYLLDRDKAINEPTTANEM